MLKSFEIKKLQNKRFYLIFIGGLAVCLVLVGTFLFPGGKVPEKEPVELLFDVTKGIEPHKQWKHKQERLLDEGMKAIREESTKENDKLKAQIKALEDKLAEANAPTSSKKNDQEKAELVLKMIEASILLVKF